MIFKCISIGFPPLHRVHRRRERSHEQEENFYRFIFFFVYFDIITFYRFTATLKRLPTAAGDIVDPGTQANRQFFSSVVRLSVLNNFRQLYRT